MDIDTRRLRFFVEVVRRGGFSQAANVVFASQSTVSKAVKQLETDLGAPLLNRIGHRSEMTAAGQILVQPIAAEFDWQEVRTDPLMVLLPSDHALAGRRRVKLAKLTGLPVILLDDGMGVNEPVLEAFQDAGIKPSIAAASGQTDFIFELVAAGAGIAFLPRTQAEMRTHQRVRSVLLDDPGCQWSIALAWVRGGSLSHAAQTWLAHAREMRGEAV